MRGQISVSQPAPRLTARQFIQQLKSAGFVEVSQTGSHLKLFNQQSRRTAIVPIHGNRAIAIGTLKAIEKQADIEFS
jgi:predicted RNA binding protein YcfA (HicA-like mRNA interferase family)